MSNNVNLSTDIIRRDRFHCERSPSGGGQQITNYSINNNNVYDNNCMESSETSRSFNLFREIAWLLSYNQNGIPYMMVAILHLFVILFGLSFQLIYSFLPFDRDPITQQYTNSILMQMESLNLISFFEQCHLFNKINAVHLMQNLVSLLRNIHQKVKNSRLNRYKYKRVNIVQIDMAYAHEIVGNLSGWTKFLMTLGRHDCNIGASLRTRRGQAMKRLSQNVKKLTRIDRLYYFNQIEFNQCYEHLNIHLDSANSQPVEPKCTWSDYLFCLNLPGRRAFIPEPAHRMDPRELCVMCYLVICGSLTEACLLITAIFIYLDLGGITLESVCEQPKLLISASLCLFFFLPIAIDAYDSANVCYSSFFVPLESQKVGRYVEKRARDSP